MASSGPHPRIKSTSAPGILYVHSGFQAYDRQHHHNEEVMLTAMMGVLTALYLKSVCRDNEDKIPSKISMMQAFGQQAGPDL